MAFEMIDLYRLYQCESGDIKKTDNIDKGSILDETDTGFQYKFNGISWVYFPQPVTDVRTHEIINNEVPIIKNTTDNLIPIDTTIGGTVIVPANPNRVSIEIQNVGTTPVLLAFGEDPIATDFSKVVAGGSAPNVGDGGEYNDNNTNFVWKGAIYGLTETGSSTVAVLEKAKVT